MLVSAADILPSISRREEQVSFFFLPLLTRENARGVPPSSERERHPRASASRPFLFSCTRTRVDDYVSEVALPNVIADGNSDLLGMDVKRILFSFFSSPPFFPPFFFKSYLGRFIYTRLNRIDGSADRARTEI